MGHNIHDIGIIGLGVAGVFCAYKLAKEHKKLKVIGFDLGRPNGKRRRQIDGFFGCFPFSDGKLYQSDFDKVVNLTGLRKAKSANTYLKHILEQITSIKVIKDKIPSTTMEKKLSNIGYQIVNNDYVQMYPKEIHTLSKYMADSIELNKNISFHFDCEVNRIVKQKNSFIISAEGEEYHCKKLIIAVGRSGWRWASQLYQSLGIVEDNDTAHYGMRIECNSNIMKDFNKSNCTIYKDNEVELGPLSWFGTVIPEDHVDVAISSFRSNENRWKTDKVSFPLIGHRHFPNGGYQQTDRLSKLAFVLSDDRIVKERVSAIVNGKSRLSIIPEYDWLKGTISELSQAIPEITTKAYCHFPTIMPLTPQINIGDNLSTELDGLYVVGESANIIGILGACLTGLVAADTICK